MNEKLRGAVIAAWNEPRHFFLWLAMLSLCGFAVAVAITNLTSGSLVPAFAALAGLGSFLASMAAFILAWLPPVRRLLVWLLHRRVLVLGCLVTLVALFYAVENWRGRRAWQEFKRDAEAKGERFDPASFAPAPVPADQNFFETPLWTDLHSVETNHTRTWDDKSNRVVLDAFGPRGGNTPSTGNWLKAQHADLAAWQAFYRGGNNLFSAATGPATNYFPVAPQPQSPAADVLLALSKFDANRQLLMAAAARPGARFWVNYENGYGMLLPHLPRLKACSQYLALHAAAALKAGDRQVALEDVKLLFRLLDSIHREPLVISHLVRVAMLQIATQPVWEGLAERQWTDADLSALEGELSKLDFLEDYHFAMRSERACHLWTVDYLRKVGLAGLDEMAAAGPTDSPTEDFGKPLARAAFSLIPAGWFDQNKLSICRADDSYLLAVVDRQQHVVSPTLARRSSLIRSQLSWGPYDILPRLFLPALAGVAERSARAQTSVDLAVLACALERYRLANGQFPETLEPLAPKLIEPLPHDIINGEPLRYRRINDDQFLLYSVGWNQTDDGGKVELTKSGSPDPNQGDWVWRYPGK